MRLDPDTLLYALDLFGTTGFALSGALRALHRRPDFVGMMILAGAAAAGGGMLRDVLLRREVVMLHDWGLPVVILASAAVTFFFPALVARSANALKYCDAVGLGVFSAITASVAARTPGVNPLAILYLATITGCAGGVIRDLLIGEPTLVLANELYVTPAILGAAALLALRYAGAGDQAALATAATVTTAVRILAIRYDWRLPRTAHVHAA